jgi:hypothetical protein
MTALTSDLGQIRGFGTVLAAILGAVARKALACRVRTFRKDVGSHFSSKFIAFASAFNSLCRSMKYKHLI